MFRRLFPHTGHLLLPDTPSRLSASNSGALLGPMCAVVRWVVWHQCDWAPRSARHEAAGCAHFSSSLRVPLLLRQREVRTGPKAPATL